jgi:hypothetical protein
MGFIASGLKSIVKAVVGVVKGVVKVVGKVAFGLIGMVTGRGNAANQATDGRLNKSLDPEDHRKIVFGETAGGCDMRFFEMSGDRYDRLHEIIAVATHTIESYGDFFVESEKIPFDGTGGVFSGNYDGAIHRQLHLGGSAGPITGVGSGTYWDANSKFTGVAHYHLKWTVKEERLPNGVPSRYTQKIKGAKVYDPRKDTTRGGSGAHRADDQLTWEYAPLDSNGKPIGRNNALQMLWYLIGWKINGKLVAGRGIDLGDINFAEFIIAANDAEARGHYTDMILSTGDTHDTNEGIISADGLLGELLDPGGLWTYKVIRDDTADVAVALTDDHVVEGGSVEWVPAVPMGDQFNEVAGTYIDPSDTSIFQPKAYPLVTNAAYQTADGFKKRVTHNFQSVQDPMLAQKLARIKLNRTRFPGEFKATFNYNALKAQVWSVVTLTLERYNFSAKLFRVYSQAITEAGIEMVLREEDPSIYAAGSDTTPPADGVIVPFDPFQSYPLTGLTGTAIKTTDALGNVQVGAQLAWGEPSGQVQRVEIEYKPASGSVYQPGGSVPSPGTTADVVGLVGSLSYDFRLRTVSLNGIVSAWQTVTVAMLPTSSGYAAGSNEIRDMNFGGGWTRTSV